MRRESATKVALVCVMLLLATALAACTKGGNSPAVPPGNPTTRTTDASSSTTVAPKPTLKIVVTKNSVKPRTVTASVEQDITFVSGDSQAHSIFTGKDYLGTCQKGQPLVIRASKAGTFQYRVPPNPKTIGTIIAK
jgi:hypothetical protein